MAPMDERVSNTSLQRQIAELSARVNEIANGVVEIKTMLRQVEERVRKLENNEAAAHPLMESRIDAAWRKLEEHDQSINTLKDVVARLDHSNRLMAWLGGILGSTVVIWLVTQILAALAAPK